MGIMNLIRADWTGKVGQLVGAKWKDKSTIRSYTKPTYTNTDAQQTIRTGFKEITSYVALFADQIRTLTALDTSGMSVRNAIIKLNKEMVIAGELDRETLQISRGGLPVPVIGTLSWASASSTLSIPVTAVSATTISSKAKIVIVAVDDTSHVALAFTVDNVTKTAEQVINGITPASTHVYAYLLDYRGSYKVASMSEYIGTIPTA